MNQNSIYFEYQPTTTVHTRGKKTDSIGACHSTSKRLSFLFSVAFDGIKLSLFAIFKGNPGKKIENMLPSITHPGIFTFVQ